MAEIEQRSDTQLREIFEECYQKVLALLDPEQGLLGQPMIRQVHIQIHEAYPMLKLQEVAILVPALQRAFYERNPMKAGVRS
jgi:hypothetical protein